MENIYHINQVPDKDLYNEENISDYELDTSHIPSHYREKIIAIVVRENMNLFWSRIIENLDEEREEDPEKSLREDIAHISVTSSHNDPAMLPFYSIQQDVAQLGISQIQNLIIEVSHIIDHIYIDDIQQRKSRLITIKNELYARKKYLDTIT